MWTAETEIVDDESRRLAVVRDGRRLSYADVVVHWQSDEDFRAFFVRLLAEAPYDAYLWETPPISRATVGRGFEFVLVDSPELARLTPDPEAFAPHFKAAPSGAAVVGFANLGGDAFLIAPALRAAAGAYPHLAAFSRGAPIEQQHEFWRTVGTQVAGRLSPTPLWLSTCGLGVAWLHVRLDSRPKYYTYQAYRTAAQTRGSRHHQGGRGA